ncbi:conserved hypothetical protein [Prochlorococcus marinus str. MIT 9515]|uniref:Uncharacterized protein n=1 Tax=Prochlorococcus marinus (strain MIT 9515) TaxID=167542 RepID=A2BX96_PROM5|nr:hypothetical protein [Prochlorococcus marinus]ABM72407.1 conserved hypothetical protein [Prochlorococcus marinus str. MIT 9515]
MKFLKLIPIIFIFLGIFPSSNLIYAEGQDPNSYKVLSNNNKKLSIKNVQAYITEGDTFIEKGNFDEAKSSYDKARNLAKQLAGFYRDLNGAFRGLDSRIPDETGEKGRESIRIWAESNARLVALYKRRNQPEVAVPLLVEIIRLMSPKSSTGKEAYKDLIQLGFVETPYRGS